MKRSEGTLAGLVTFDDWVECLSEQVQDWATLLELEAERRLARRRVCCNGGSNRRPRGNFRQTLAE